MIATCKRWLVVNLGQALARRGADRDVSIDLALEDNGTWSTRVRRASIEVSCLSGTVWVTCEGDPEDHVLPQGATFVTSREGRLAMMAFGPAGVRVVRRGRVAGAALAAPSPVVSLARKRRRA